MRLLLAEDERSLARALTVLLRKNNYEVDAVYDGEEAMAYLGSGNYDGAILDIMMPKRDGIDVLCQLRRQGNRLPVLLLTAKSEVDDKVLGLDSGANDYLTKPFAAQELLARMVDADVDVCACEVSSHALDLGRVRGSHFAVAAFSNLTQDHLDYHKTMEEYFAAKARLFTECEPDACVICTDSPAGERMAQLCADAGRTLYRVGSGSDCDVRLVEARFDAHATRIDLEACGEWLHVTIPLVGRFNVENALVTFGIGVALGFTNELIVSALETAPQVPGRLERVVGTDGRIPDFGVLVDYAHTPDSIEKAIDAVRAVTQGRVICVFGCGGDRDHGKRPKMGAAALSADIAVVTSDNPRTEDPDAIIEQILVGMEGHEDRYVVMPDRSEAICYAIEAAGPGDVVLIAGKGHEDYQIVGTVKHHFDDREVVAHVLDEMRS